MPAHSADVITTGSSGNSPNSIAELVDDQDLTFTTTRCPEEELWFAPRHCSSLPPTQARSSFGPPRDSAQILHIVCSRCENAFLPTEDTLIYFSEDSSYDRLPVRKKA
ncbi:hypothetical protein HPB50_014370 [Hyalomma asiaticum]|uniref:Uncharacterized protein n=1 Tax=Hyalomma asiaticum TaxID=266040 RepID=A0ACB7TJZ3_HYAAI|nr:hypothetical protein HPB50_014370 [Hyalomma asiaticum]